MLFKLLGRLAIPLNVAVPLNYLTCALAGFRLGGPGLFGSGITEQAWFLLSAAQGLFFYSGFSLLALASQQIGVAVAALYSRLAMVIPVVIALIFLGETINIPRSLGISITLASLVLLSIDRSPCPTRRHNHARMLLPGLFLFNGIQLTLMNLSRFFFLADDQSYHAYMAASFFFAFVVSASVMGLGILSRRVILRPIYLLGGIVLGLCNYTCVFHLIKALAAPGWGSGQVFPLFSVGVVGGSALAARLFFRETLSGRQWCGLGLGLLAVGLLGRG